MSSMFGQSILISELGGVIAKYNFQQILLAGGLLASRVLGMIFLAPFLGGKLVPNQVKVGIALALGVAVFPYVINLQSMDALFLTPSLYPLSMRMIGYITKEVFIGTILGFIILTIWHGTEMVGRFVDTARGSAMGTAAVPQMKAQASTLGSLYYQLLLLVFLVLDGHLIFIEYFGRSFILIPIYGVPRFDAGMWPFFDMLIKLTAQLFTVAIALSAPVMIAIFVTDVCMGLFNKVAPQINVLFLMMPFKAVLGILISMIALLMFVQESEKMMGDVLGSLWLAIRYLTPY